MGPIPRIRNYTVARLGQAPYSYDPLDPYAGQEFGRPAVPPAPGPAVPPPPVNPMIAAIEAGRFEEYEPPVPPSPTGGYTPTEPESIRALREHSQALPEYEKQPWWKTAAGLALSSVNLAPAQIGARKLLYGDNPRKMAEWQEKQAALEKAATEEREFSKSRTSFEQQRLTEEADLAEKGLVQVDINDPEFKRSDYEMLTPVGGKVWGKPKERMTAKEAAKDTTDVPRSVFEAAGLQHLLEPGEQSRRMKNAQAEKLFGNYLEQIKPTTLGAGQVKIGGPGQKPLAVGPPRLITDYPTARTSKIDPLTSEATEIRKHPITERQPRAAGTRTTNPYQATINQIEAEYRRNVASLRKEARGITKDYGFGPETTGGMTDEAVKERMQELEDLREDAYLTQVPENLWPESRRAGIAGGDEEPQPAPVPTPGLPIAAPSRGQLAGEPAVPPPPGPAIPPPPPTVAQSQNVRRVSRAQLAAAAQAAGFGADTEGYRQQLIQEAREAGIQIVFD